jgi:hypothetical protein
MVESRPGKNGPDKIAPISQEQDEPNLLDYLTKEEVDSLLSVFSPLRVDPNPLERHLQASLREATKNVLRAATKKIYHESPDPNGNED